MIVDLNCDLGEGAENDADLLRLATSANVCCGAHAGGEAIARATLALAKAANVVVGAHPGYPDREHFGRRELHLDDASLAATIRSQVADLITWAHSIGVPVRYLKPHGALYNQACRDERIARPIVEVAAEMGLPILALPHSLLEMLSRGRVPFVREGFADRRYRPDGSLLPRSEPNAILTDVGEAVDQAIRLVRERGVRSLCVHGDHPDSLAFVRALRAALPAAGIEIAPCFPRTDLLRADDTPLGRTSSLAILDSGLETRLVDYGRPRGRRFGVAVGGAADVACFNLANALVGNPPGTPGLEIAVRGPTLRADVDVACALVGAPFNVSRGGSSLRPQSSFTLEAGRELVIGGCPRGMRAYLCVAGGFDGPNVLGSRGGIAPVRVGDRLSCRGARVSARTLSVECPFVRFPTARTLRVTSGPQTDWIPDDALTSGEYLVGRDSNRMGIRLEGTPSPVSREMVSEPVCPGCVQMTREGLPIILGVDGQTIGGYPKVAVVVDADRDALGQLRPGDRVRFERIDLAAADAAWSERRELLNEWIVRIRAALDVAMIGQ